MNAQPVVPAERRWVLGFAALAMLATTIPYLVGFASQGEDWVFTGFVFAVDDGNSYIAKMLGGNSGEWLFRSPYTQVPQVGLLLYLPYLVLGKLAAPPALHLQLVVLYHLFRIGAGLLVFLATYDFLSLFITRIPLRRWGLALATLGGGLGWALILLGRTEWLGTTPLDFNSPETFGFLSLYGLPHLALARALLLWGLAKYLKAAAIDGERGTLSSDKAGVSAGMLWLLLGLTQPLTVFVGWVILSAHLAALSIKNLRLARSAASADWVEWRRYFRRAVWAISVSAPLALFVLSQSNTDAFFQAWAARNIIPSPSPWHSLLAWGLLLPFAFFGGRRILQGKGGKGLLPVAWVMVIPFLVYSPVSFQRRLAEGAWVPLVILALLVFDRPREERPKRLHPAILSLTFPTTVILLVGGYLVARTPETPAFRPSGEVAAMGFLSEAVTPGEVVLAGFEAGNVLPAWAPVRVLAGSGPESIDLEEMLALIDEFFSSTTPDDERIALIEEYEISLVFWGPAERALGDWDPTEAGYLALIYTGEGYSVFSVVDLP